MSVMAAITAIARMMMKSFARTLQMCRWETGVRGGWLPVSATRQQHFGGCCRKINHINKMQLQSRVTGM
jgi:hypothetical protein